MLGRRFAINHVKYSTYVSDCTRLTWYRLPRARCACPAQNSTRLSSCALMGSACRCAQCEFLLLYWLLRTYVRTYARTYARTHVRTHVHTHARMHIGRYYVRTYEYTYVRRYVRAYLGTVFNLINCKPYICKKCAYARISVRSYKRTALQTCKNTPKLQTNQPYNCRHV